MVYVHIHYNKDWKVGIAILLGISVRFSSLQKLETSITTRIEALLWLHREVCQFRSLSTENPLQQGLKLRLRSRYFLWCYRVRSGKTLRTNPLQQGLKHCRRSCGNVHSSVVVKHCGQIHYNKDWNDGTVHSAVKTAKSVVVKHYGQIHYIKDWNTAANYGLNFSP